MNPDIIRNRSALFVDLVLQNVTENDQSGLIGTFASSIKNEIVKVSSDFSEIELEKLSEELRVLSIEIFSLNFIHKFGIDLSIPQSLFVKDYLFYKERQDVWDNMTLYNKAISHAVNVHSQTSDTLDPDAYQSVLKYKAESGETLMSSIAVLIFSSGDFENFLLSGYDIYPNDKEYIFPLKYPGGFRIFGDMSYMPGFHYLSRMGLGGKYVNMYKELGMEELSNSQSIARVVNRDGSKKVWEKGLVTYYLTLALFSRLGFGAGPEYLGPSREVQLIMKDFINHIYKLSDETWN